MRRLRSAFWTSLVVLTSAVQGCGGSAPADAGAPQPMEVEIVSVVVRDYAVTVTGLATIAPQSGRLARVAAPGESFVTRARVSAGDAVAVGTPLVELDRSVWTEQAREADAALAAAEEGQARIERLVNQGILPRKDLEAATAERARARAIAADANRRLERAVLRSPIPGVVTSVTAALSQPVAANDVLVEIMSRDGLDAIVRLSPHDAALVEPNATVELFAGVDPSAQSLASGVVAGVSAAMDRSSGTVAVRVAMSAVNADLRAGQTVSARITVAHHAGAVVVPRAALVPMTGGVMVFVVDAEGVVHATPLGVGAGDGDWVEVISGLTGTERVVADGAYGLVDGARVRPTGTP